MSYGTRHVDALGRRTRILEAGAGKPLLLIHAFPLSAELWRPQLERPPAGWRVIAPDLPAFGPAASSEPAALPGSMDDYAAHIEAVAGALGLQAPVVGGLSMGGYVMFALVRRGKLRVRGLIFADTRAEADTDEGRAGRRKMMALADAEGAAGVAREMLPKLVGETTRRERREIVDTVQALITSNPPAGIKAALGAMMGRPDSTSLLPSIEAPSLVIVGEEDGLTPPSNAETLARGIRGSRLVQIPGAGHLSSLERPGEFSAALDAFLQRPDL